MNPSGVETNQADQTPVDSHAEDGETGAVCPKTTSPTDIQERETIARELEEQADRTLAGSHCRAETLFKAVDLIRALSSELSEREAEDDPLAEYKAMNARLAADLRTALRSNPQPGSEGWSFADFVEAYEAAPPGMQPLERERFIADWFRNREWFKRRAGLEGDLEVGVGFSMVEEPLYAASPTPPTAQPGEVERLRSALEPFAAISLGVTDSDAHDHEDWFRHDGETLSVGDFRRARAALTPSESQEAGPQWTCTRCGRDEIDARANGCTRGPCPMVPR